MQPATNSAKMTYSTQSQANKGETSAMSISGLRRANYFPPITTFEDYKPPMETYSHLLINQNNSSTHVNTPDAWIKSPPQVTSKQFQSRQALKHQQKQRQRRQLLQQYQKQQRLQQLRRRKKQQQRRLRQQQILMTSAQTRQSSSSSCVVRHSHQRENMASIHEIIDLTSPPPSPVPPTVQKASRDETSNKAAYEIVEIRLKGKNINCVNAVPYIKDADMMVALDDLVHLFPSSLLTRCAYILINYLNIKIRTGNSEQMSVLRKNCPPMLLDITPFVMLEDIIKALPKLSELTSDPHI